MWLDSLVNSYFKRTCTRDVRRGLSQAWGRVIGMSESKKMLRLGKNFKKKGLSETHPEQE